MSEAGWVHISFTRIIRETEAAFAVELATVGGGKRFMWIPFSQIEDNGTDYKQGDKNGSMCVTEWFARKARIS